MIQKPIGFARSTLRGASELLEIDRTRSAEIITFSNLKTLDEHFPFGATACSPLKMFTETKQVLYYVDAKSVGQLFEGYL